MFSLAVGFINGYLVMRTGIPSFLITLGTFFVLQGANLGITKLVTGSVSTPNINQMDGYASLKAVFSSSFKIGAVTVWTSVMWWIAFVALSAYILQRTKIGNWIYAVGGNADSARAVGVPVQQGQDRSVHECGLPRLVHRHAHALPLRHAAGRQRHRQRVPLHHRRRGGWHA